MNGVRLDYEVPPSDLADFVTVFYDFYADVPVFEDVERADHAQLRLRLSPGVGRYRFPDDSTQFASEFHVIGPTSGAFLVTCEGPVEVFGMGLTPAGWAALIGNDASNLLNRTINAAALFGETPFAEAAAALRGTTDRARRYAAGAALVRRLLHVADSDLVRFTHSVDGWLAGEPSPEIDGLVDATGLSRRQVERKCKALYGAPPKLLARKYRALRAAVMLAQTDQTLDEVIARGFYDQSHLIREIKQFTGLTPRQIRHDATPLAHLTITQRSALDGRVSPIISRT